MTATPVDHSTFTIERDLPASPRHAFRFWSEPALKQRWNDCHTDWTVLEDIWDFREGGAEAKRWRLPAGGQLVFRAQYFEIVPRQRIIYAFEMGLDGARISVSLATVSFAPLGAAQTRLTFTEQLAFLGDPEARSARVAGTGTGFDRLVDEVTREVAGVH